MDNGARMMGCWNGLGKRAAAGLDFGDDAQPAKRAVAFSNAIRQSKQFTEYFPQVIEACINAALDGLRSAVVGIDGHPAAGRLAPAAWAFAARDVTSELLTITPRCQNQSTWATQPGAFAKFGSTGRHQSTCATPCNSVTSPAICSPSTPWLSTLVSRIILS